MFWALWFRRLVYDSCFVLFVAFAYLHLCGVEYFILLIGTVGACLIALGSCLFVRICNCLLRG